jgi:hypothetical protein
MQEVRVWDSVWIIKNLARFLKADSMLGYIGFRFFIVPVE